MVWDKKRGWVRKYRWVFKSRHSRDVRRTVLARDYQEAQGSVNAWYRTPRSLHTDDVIELTCVWSGERIVWTWAGEFKQTSTTFSIHKAEP